MVEGLSSGGPGFGVQGCGAGDRKGQRSAELPPGSLFGGICRGGWGLIAAWEEGSGEEEERERKGEGRRGRRFITKNSAMPTEATDKVCIGQPESTF